MRINKVRVAVCATFAVFNSEILQYALGDDAQACLEGWSDWTACSEVSGLQERHNPSCPDIVQVQECKTIAGCGEFTAWSPSEVSCVRGTVQSRYRSGCPEVREVKVCEGTDPVCTDNWTDWTACDANDMQERHNPDCHVVEVRECTTPGGGGGDCNAQCGEWGEWNPHLDPCDPNSCQRGVVYRRQRQGCPQKEETKMCGSFSCSNCAPKSRCCPLVGSCTCITGYEGDGFGPNGCTRIDICKDNPCDVNANCSLGSSYTYAVCRCKLGWDGDKFAGKKDYPCVDEDECAANTHSCPEHTECINTIGSYECSCKAGFRQAADGSCVDINECAESSPCQANSVCVNHDGGYKCECNEGYAGEGTVNSPCVNVDECLTDVCSASAICTDTEGSYLCSCPPGYNGSGTKQDPCTKIDFCGDSSLHSCGPHATCVNELPSYKCVCDEGYAGVGTTKNPCTDINECNVDQPSHDCDDNATCHNTNGSFTCQCNNGFVAAGDNPGHGINGCLDIDECATENPCDPNATCVNKFGGYTCTCHEGFEDISKDGKKCRDINECTTGDFTCHASADCQNTEGSYQCTCKSGFLGDGKVCNDIDECEKQPCGENTDCVNTVGGFNCECKTGYHKLDKNQACSNIDECADGTAKIPANAVCEDTQGSYSWSCKPGYENVGEGCTKIDWCSRNVCHPLASCAETPDGLSYTCTCITGYSGDGLADGTCTDIDECQGKHACSTSQDGGICTNTVGSYTCSCQEGFSQQGNVCSDINECSESKHNCSSSAQCANTKGSFTCTCNPGYQGDGVTCSDVDECATGAHNCGSNTVCVNSVGSFECGCLEGFARESATSCKDIDECSTGAHNCSTHGTCTNTSGSFTCECKPGFEGDGVQCSDIDFCANQKHECNEHAECSENDAGTAIKCTCVAGYGGNGFGSEGCTDINECETGKFTCPEHSDCKNTAGSYECECKKGFLTVGSGGDLQCHDIDECSFSHSCASVASGGVCENTIGSYSCSCRDGYKGDGKQCSDIDECEEGIHKCSSHTRCINDSGLYTCACEEGYARVDAYTCQDIDECAESTAVIPANATCENTDGGYDFTCNAGYRRVGNVCQKIDFCKEKGCSPKATCQENETGTAAICSCVDGYSGDGVGPDGCLNINECENDVCSSYGPGGACNDLEGSFECRCTKGWLLSNGTCVDQNECMSGRMNTCDNIGGICTNTPGSYECSCKDGFQGDGHTCVDIDECSGKNTCHKNATCTNIIGSYNCECNEGFSGDGKNCVDIDECATPSDNKCDSHRAICTNTDGSYTCKCRNGFGGDGFSCTNVDECTTGDYTCQDNSHCVDTVGSYTCECNGGYTLSGEKCIDVDECSIESHNCSINATCANTQGSFTCTCVEGYEGDGVDCTRIPLPCESDPCGPNSNCADLNFKEHLCTCVEGYHMGDYGCEDTDECLTDNSCDTHANCINTDGSYTCECRPGYEGDGYSCHDIDECSTGIESCSSDALCTNTQGSYTCRCRTGFMGDGFSCIPKPVTDGQEFCTEWSAWTSCAANATHSTRYCYNDASKLEIKECGEGQTDCGEFGPWSECSPSNMRERQREHFGQAGCENAREESECPHEEIVQHCGEWTQWTNCNVPLRGFQMRNRERCSDESEYQECSEDIQTDPKPGVCGSWDPWSKCLNLGDTGVFTQSRNCADNTDLYETRECGAVPVQCGNWLPWSECQDNKQTRTREFCPDSIEIKACATPDDECGPWGEWGKCNIVIDGAHYRTRSRTICNTVEAEVCTPEIEGEAGCRGWSNWSACENGVQHRNCVAGLEASETRLCGDETCSINGEWTPTPCYGDEEITREYTCGESIGHETSICSSLPDPSCGEWGPWSKCNILIGEHIYKSRKLMSCEETEMALCSPTEIPQENVACGTWSECESNKQHRKCESSGNGTLEVITEVRECGALDNGPCGLWGEWSECDVNGMQIRHKESCPDVAETRLCGAEECSNAFGEWGSCGVPSESIRVRHRIDCVPVENCDCIESEECTIEMSIESESVEAATPEEEKEEEESGFPTAAVAGGVAGVVLVAALAGGGAAYARSGGGGDEEVEQLMFEDADAIEGAEDAREADTVIDITEEDDYWADGGDVE